MPGPELTPSAVHVWSAVLSAQAGLAALVDEQERARAARFRFDKDRQRFLAAHGAERRILGAYLGVAPGALRFDRGPHGKPFLSGSALRFNLSHSGDMALLAVACGREVGVDVEEVRPRPRLGDVADRYFLPEERAQLHAVPAERQAAEFFRLWTRKEAVYKAAGVGVAAGLASPPEPARWRVVELAPAAGYAGALAVEAADADPQLLVFSLEQDPLPGRILWV